MGVMKHSKMSGPILSARKLSVHSINEMLISLQTLTLNELREKIKVCSSDIKNDIKLIHKLWDDIDRVNKRYSDLLERCLKMAGEINDLRSKLDRVDLCEHCKWMK